MIALTAWSMAAIHTSGLGLQVGNVCVSGLLFADDLVVVGKTSSGLKTLLNLVKKHFDALKLKINEEKSEVISPHDETWDLLDRNYDTEMSLKQVAQYKYLGTWTYGSMYKTAVEKLKRSVTTASKYKNCCIYVSKMGPDIVDVVLCTWSNVAIPSILAGFDFIPFTETRIQEIERIQSQVGKFALGVPVNFPNVSCQSELGLKPFRQILYEKQVKFYFRLLHLSPDRWSHQALLDHMSGTWNSPYMTYMCSIRTELGIFSSTNNPKFWKPLSSKYFLDKSNNSLSMYSSINPLEELSRAKYVSENEMSSIITKFKFDTADLGEKAPRAGYPRKQYCPLCPVQHKSSCFHVVFVCSSLSALRSATGIKTFITTAAVMNINLEKAYALFVNGLDCYNNSVSLEDYYERARCMRDMRLEWLSKW